MAEQVCEVKKVHKGYQSGTRTYYYYTLEDVDGNTLKAHDSDVCIPGDDKYLEEVDYQKRRVRAALKQLKAFRSASRLIASKKLGKV